MDFSYLSFSIYLSLFVCLFFLISFQFIGQIFALLLKKKKKKFHLYFMFYI